MEWYKGPVYLVQSLLPMVLSFFNLWQIGTLRPCKSHFLMTNLGLILCNHTFCAHQMILILQLEWPTGSLFWDLFVLLAAHTGTILWKVWGLGPYTCYCVKIELHVQCPKFTESLLPYLNIMSIIWFFVSYKVLIIFRIIGVHILSACNHATLNFSRATY